MQSITTTSTIHPNTEAEFLDADVKAAKKIAKNLRSILPELLGFLKMVLLHHSMNKTMNHPRLRWSMPVAPSLLHDILSLIFSILLFKIGRHSQDSHLVQHIPGTIINPADCLTKPVA
jgi:hypothetical protein